MIKVGLSSSADLNVSLSGGAADAGVTYEAVGGKFTVNASGVITPIKAGVGLVVVKNSSTNQVLKKIAVAVVPDAELANFQNIQSTATSVVSSSGNSGQSGSSSTFVDQEVVTFENDGSYILANASSGIEANSVPMLVIDGVVQDGVTATKRFNVVNDAGGVKRKVQLYRKSVNANFTKVSTPTIATTASHNGLSLSGGSVVKADASTLSFDSGNFTLEAWVYIPSISGYHTVATTRPADGGFADAYVFGVAADGAIYVYTNAIFPVVTPAGTVTSGTWTHIAWVRQGTTLTVYVNGTSISSGTVANNFTRTQLTVGGNPDGAYNLNGTIRNLRLTKAARYTSAFTPFAVSSDVTQLADEFVENTVLKASFNSLSNGNFIWSVESSLLPDSSSKCLISYRA